jgi:hypothetical protein
MALFRKDKYPIPVEIFRTNAGGGLTSSKTSARYALIKGNRRLILKSGLIIKMDSTSQAGNTFYTYTPDEKVFFPIRFRSIGKDIIDRLKAAERENTSKIQELWAKQDLSFEEKDEQVKDLLLSKLSDDEKALVKEYALNLDIIPDATAYEIHSQQLEEAVRVKNQKKQKAMDKYLPIIMVVGISIAFAIMGYATITYINGMSSNFAHNLNSVVSGLQAVAHSLSSVGASSHAVNSTTLPATP